VTKRAGAEGGHLAIQLGGDPGDLGPGAAGVHAQTLTRSSTLRVETPCTEASITAASRARSMRRRGSSRAGKNQPSRSLGSLSSTSPALVDSSRDRGAVAVGGALLAALIGPGADVLGGLGLDQPGEDQADRLADDVQVTADAQCIQQLGQGRLAEAIVRTPLGGTPAGTH
jgi:hypothetical protein